MTNIIEFKLGYLELSSILILSCITAGLINKILYYTYSTQQIDYPYITHLITGFLGLGLIILSIYTIIQTIQSNRQDTPKSRTEQEQISIKNQKE